MTSRVKLMERKWEDVETFKTEFIIHEFRFLMIASDPRYCQAQRLNIFPKTQVLNLNLFQSIYLFIK